MKQAHQTDTAPAQDTAPMRAVNNDSKQESTKERQRRKVPTVDEMVQAARLLDYDARKTVIKALAEDLDRDINDDLAREEKAHLEQLEKLEKLRALRD